MNQKMIGSFLKELRKEKGITQEQFGEQMGVSGRTVSRWETGSNMPDLDVLILISEFYGVELREILDGERKDEQMNKELKEDVLKVADYSNEEKIRMMKRLHILSWIGVVSFMIFMILEEMNLADNGITGNIASYCAGNALGMLIVAVLYTSRYMNKFKAFKRRLLHRQEK